MQTTSTPPRPQEKGPESERLVEVNLVRNYCPHYLVMPDGSVRPNGGNVPEKVMPGIVMMHPDDAQIALESQAALPTKKTFRM